VDDEHVRINGGALLGEVAEPPALDRADDHGLRR
jgi:hypothetical protein